MKNTVNAVKRVLDEIGLSYKKSSGDKTVFAVTIPIRGVKAQGRIQILDRINTISVDIYFTTDRPDLRKKAKLFMSKVNSSAFIGMLVYDDDTNSFYFRFPLSRDTVSEDVKTLRFRLQVAIDEYEILAVHFVRPMIEVTPNLIEQTANFLKMQRRR